jgi:hypothetical protein
MLCCLFRASVTLGFLGWMALMLHLVVAEYTPVGKLVEQYNPSQLTRPKLIFAHRIFYPLGLIVLVLCAGEATVLSAAPRISVIPVRVFAKSKFPSADKKFRSESEQSVVC